MAHPRGTFYLVALLVTAGMSLVSTGPVVGPPLGLPEDKGMDGGGDAPTPSALWPPGPADTNPPTGAIISPDPNTWQTYTYVYLQVWFSDPDGIANSSLYAAIDGDPLRIYWTTIGSQLWLYAESYRLSDGIHSAEVRASDLLGNGPTVLQWSFSRDANPPEVEITSPVGDPVLASAYVMFAWTGNDTGSGIDHYEVRLDDGPWMNVGNVTTFPFNGLEPGVHYFYVRASDVAGNSDYDGEVAIGTVPRASPPPPSPANTTFVVNVPAEMPSWALALLVLNAAELAAIVSLSVARVAASHAGSGGRDGPDS